MAGMTLAWDHYACPATLSAHGAVAATGRCFAEQQVVEFCAANPPPRAFSGARATRGAGGAVWATGWRVSEQHNMDFSAADPSPRALTGACIVVPGFGWPGGRRRQWPSLKAPGWRRHRPARRRRRSRPQ
eukprot:gene16389-biopygen9787